MSLWTNNPRVLIEPEHVFELLPSSCMSYNERQNAYARAVIVITLVVFAFTRSIIPLAIGAIVLAWLYVQANQEAPAASTLAASIVEPAKTLYEQFVDGFGSHREHRAYATDVPKIPASHADDSQPLPARLSEPTPICSETACEYAGVSAALGSARLDASLPGNPLAPHTKSAPLPGSRAHEHQLAGDRLYREVGELVAARQLEHIESGWDPIEDHALLQSYIVPGGKNTCYSNPTITKYGETYNTVFRN